MQVHHIDLLVEDLEGARAFFVMYFQASAGERYHNEKTGFSSYFLTMGEGAKLEIMHDVRYDATFAKEVQLGYHHLAISLGSKEAVDTLTERLRQDGYQVLSGPRTTGDGYYESCISAFEGIRIELTV